MSALSHGWCKKVGVRWCCQEIPKFMFKKIQLSNFLSTLVMIITDGMIVIDITLPLIIEHVHNLNYCSTCYHSSLTNTPTSTPSTVEHACKKQPSEQLNILKLIITTWKDVSKSCVVTISSTHDHMLMKNHFLWWQIKWRGCLWQWISIRTGEIV